MPSFATLTTEQRLENARKARETLQARAIPVDIDSVTFGVEIECALPQEYCREIGLEVGSYHHGDSLPTPDFPEGWNCQSDSSVSAARYGDWNMEIVSPVLHGLEGIRQVMRVIDTIRDNGGRINRTCGLHVHVGMRSVMGEKAHDFDAVADWVRRLLNLVSMHEFGLYAITGTPSRMGNHYCESIKPIWRGKLNRNSKFNQIQNVNDYEAGRYRTVNLCNLFSNRQTVEFRVFAGTLNAIKVAGYIVTALGMCQRAAEVPTANQFCPHDTNTISWWRNTKYMEHTLGWLGDSGKRYGFPTGTWEELGDRILRNQKWNADRFDRLQSGRITEDDTEE